MKEADRMERAAETEDIVDFQSEEGWTIPKSKSTPKTTHLLEHSKSEILLTKNLFQTLAENEN